MTLHPVRWQAPQPLWTRLPSPDMQARPALLRFATDDFMEQLLATLARDPSALDQRLTRWESWREPITDVPDSIARAPLPRLAQASLRSRFAAQRKATIALAAESPIPLKLYQPAHQRYYIASASLVCGVQGLPDRAMTTGGSEEVGFVLRRLMPVPATATQPAGLREFAFIKDANGARWQRCSEDANTSATVAATSALVADEERLAAFALRFQDDGGYSRTLWSGLVPVSRREEYMGARVVTSAAPAFALGQRQSLEPATPEALDSVQARMVQFQMDVSEPWKTLIRASIKCSGELAAPTEIAGDEESHADKRQRAYEFNLQQASASWLILLDCADHLEVHLNDLWRVIVNGVGYSELSAQRKALHDFLAGASMSPALTLGLLQPDGEGPAPPALASMRDALIAMRADGVRERLEASTITYNASTLKEPDWPAFRFVLAGVGNNLKAEGPYTNLTQPTDAESADPVVGAMAGQDEALLVDRFTALFARALDPKDAQVGPRLPYAAQVARALADSADEFADGGLFWVRYVYLRRDCGPLHPPVLSTPSEPFQLASFFDADAPARPIRISLPIDTSPAGLRKFNRNTAFVLSDMLCGQVQRAKGLGFSDLVRSVLPWPFHKSLKVGKGGPCQDGKEHNIGMICSLSIPIITICALILLMIIVGLLDIIFRWMPYFAMCFPVIGLKGKKGPTP